MSSTTGTRAHSALDEIDADGKFKRTDATYRNAIEVGGEHAPEAGRYHLYIARACPWANGVLTMMHLKGLEGVISYSAAHPTWGRTSPGDPEDTHSGWIFRSPGDPPVSNTAGHGALEVDDACIPDTVNGCKSVRAVYEKAGDTVGKYTTPLLWDKQTGTIVSNESMDLLRVLNHAFDGLAKHAEIDLFPADLEEETAALNAWIYPTINDGVIAAPALRAAPPMIPALPAVASSFLPARSPQVYRSGFARSQDAYEAAVRALFESLDKVEAILATKRYLTGARLTWLDLRLFHTLVRCARCALGTRLGTRLGKRRARTLCTPMTAMRMGYIAQV